MCAMATLAHDIKHNLLPRADLLEEIERAGVSECRARSASLYHGKLRSSNVNVSGLK
jgi:hypothetical protein